MFLIPLLDVSRSNYASSQNLWEVFFLEVVAACVFHDPVDLIRGSGSARCLASIMSAECSQQCINRGTLQGETCQAFLTRVGDSLEDCMRITAPMTTLSIPWPFGILAAFSSYKVSTKYYEGRAQTPR